MQITFIIPDDCYFLRLGPKYGGRWEVVVAYGEEPARGLGSAINSSISIAADLARKAAIADSEKLAERWRNRPKPAPEKELTLDDLDI